MLQEFVLDSFELNMTICAVCISQTHEPYSKISLLGHRAMTCLLQIIYENYLVDKLEDY